MAHKLEEKAIQNMTCVGCSKVFERKGKPLPAKGKTIADQFYCGPCVKEKWAIRAITIPVVHPIGCTWKELRDKLHASWADVTAASNWMMTELYSRDIRRNGQEKLPKKERVYLYPEATKKFPSLSTNTLASLEQAIQLKYGSMRYDLIWRSAVSLPTFRYPQPISVPSKAWSLWFDESGSACVGARLQSKGAGDRVFFKLKGGARYRRQLAGLKQVAGGSAIQATMELSERRIDEEKHVVCKIVARFPKQIAKDREGSLWITSTKDYLLSIWTDMESKDGERLWLYHGEHVKRWSAEHRGRLQRLRDDRKAGVPVKFSARMSRYAEKYNDRMNSATHEISAAVAKYVLRNRVSEVLYDDRDKGFCEGFPWHSLRTKIVDKLAFHGISCITTQEEKSEESSEGEETGSVENRQDEGVGVGVQRRSLPEKIGAQSDERPANHGRDAGGRRNAGGGRLRKNTRRS
jgi:hypothetical protein